MKKYLALILVLISTLSFVACGDAATSSEDWEDETIATEMVETSVSDVTDDNDDEEFQKIDIEGEGSVILEGDGMKFEFSIPLEIGHYYEMSQLRPHLVSMSHQLGASGRTVIEVGGGTPADFLNYYDVNVSEAVEYEYNGSKGLIWVKHDKTEKSGKVIYEDFYYGAVPVEDHIIGFRIDMYYPEGKTSEINEETIKTILSHCVVVE